MNCSQVSRWLKSQSLVPYEINGKCVFPVYGVNGSISSRVMAYVARRLEDFPEGGEFGIGTGLSEDGRYAGIELDGRKKYAKQEIVAILSNVDRAIRIREGMKSCLS